MELRQLRHFIAVAEELNFTRAARRANITQPALTRSIAALEDELCVILVDRSKRQIELTTAGAAFLEDARQALGYVKRATQNAQRAGRLAHGSLKVGVTGILNLPFLSRSFEAFHRAHPEVEIEIQELFTRQQLEPLSEGTLDVGFVVLPIEDERISNAVILQEAFMVLLPQAHELAGLNEVPIEALAIEPFLMIPREFHPPAHDHILSMLWHNGVEPRIAPERATPQTRNNLVAGGFGITLTLPSWPMDLPGLVKRPIWYPSHHQPMLIEEAVAWKRDNPSALVAAFVEIVRTLMPLNA